MDSLDWMLQMLIVLLTVCYEKMFFKAAMGWNCMGELPRWKECLAILGGILLALLLAWNLLPLTVVYLLIYAAMAGMARSSGKARKIELYIVNLRFITITAMHLIGVSFMALAAEVNVKTVLEDFRMSSINMLGVLAVNFMLLLWVFSEVKKQGNVDYDYDQEEFRILMRFTWFGAVFVITDSIPCLFDLPTVLVSLFLLCSNALLIAMVFLFSHHVYSIARNSCEEDQYYELLIEQERQAARNEAMERAAYIDQRTRAYSRRYGVNMMETMIHSGEFFSLVYIDLDHLKEVNDQRGHLAGNRYLAEFVARLESLIRNQDVLVRIGGDEFMILMPECTEEEAKERIRTAQISMEEKYPFSCGVVEVPSLKAVKSDAVIDEADRLMYEDKRMRRRKERKS